MKIIIVGAGIGGLSTYLALKKHVSPLDPSLHIKIVESHSSPYTQTLASGGGLALAPNGQRSIASITTNAIPYLQSRSFPSTSMSFLNDKGGLLGVMKVGGVDRYGYDMLMTTRAKVHDALLQEIEDEGLVKWGIKVTNVKDLDEGEGGMLVEFADGTSEKADLVVGADGVRSIVKDCLLKGEYQAQYNGFIGLGGFLPLSTIPSSVKDSLSMHPVTMVFGRLGFFAYSLASPISDADPLFMWWSVYETPTLSDRNNIDNEDIKRQLLHRFGQWKSPYDPTSCSEEAGGVYRQIIELACIPPDSAPSLPTSSSGPASSKPISTAPRILPRYVTPRLPYWSNATSASSPKNKGRIVLIGDAAHTMPPDVGQGVSCAAEDAVVYALLLKHYLTAVASATAASGTPESPSKPAPTPGSPAKSILEQAALAYEAIRKPHIHKILDVAKRNVDMKKELGWFGQVVRDLIMKLVCKLPESLHDATLGFDPEIEVNKYLAKVERR